MTVEVSDIGAAPLGPGTQPGEEDGAQLRWLEMPQAVRVYRPPVLPGKEHVRSRRGALQVMDWLQLTLEGFRLGQVSAVADLSNLDGENRELVSQILCEGEVRIHYDTVPRVRIQESVLTGVWRILYLDERSALLGDLVEVGDVPALIRAARPGCTRSLVNLDRPDDAHVCGTALSILSELREQLASYRVGQMGHSLNLTLLPLSPRELGYLEETLGRGPVTMRSRGYGDCEVTSTALPNLWWVRYFNASRKLILNTLEVVEVPSVVCAAAEDIEDSARRLQDLLEPYRDLRDQAPSSA